MTEKGYITVLSILLALDRIMKGTYDTFMVTGFNPSPICVIAVSQTQDIVFFIIFINNSWFLATFSKLPFFFSCKPNLLYLLTFLLSSDLLGFSRE